MNSRSSSDSRRQNANGWTHFLWHLPLEAIRRRRRHASDKSARSRESAPASGSLAPAERVANVSSKWIEYGM